MNNRQHPHDVVRSAIEQGSALALQNLLNEGADPNQTSLRDRRHRILFECVWQNRPECIRLLIEAGADLQWNPEERRSLRILYSSFVFMHYDHRLEGELILTLDKLMYQTPTFWIEESEPDPTQTNGQYIVLRQRARHIEEGTRMHRERQGMLSLLEGRYWQDYGGQNPFFEASTAQEMMLLLMDGAANNEEGETDMTRLRSIRPALRRNVMALLQGRIDERRSLGELHVAVANNKTLGSIESFCGHVQDIFPIIADFLGVRGHLFINVRNALATFDKLATGAYESEYDAGDW